MEDSKSIYLMYGEEKFSLENQVKKIKKQFGELMNGINLINIDSSNIDNIIQDIETPAFGYPTKLIIAKDTGLFRKKAKKNVEKEENKLAQKIAEYISQNIDNIKQSVTIIFVEDDVDKNDLYKVIEKYGEIDVYETLKPFEAEKKVKSICNGYKVNIDEATLKYFVSVCGTDMQQLINEIRKQIEYVGENGKISKENIDLLAIRQLDSVIFDLTDSLGKKNIKLALEILSNMIYEREPIQKILITLYNHFKKLYLTKVAIKNKVDVAESLKLKPNQIFLIQKYTTQLQYFKEEELENILQEMIDLDYLAKIGKIDEYIGLQSILCKYCS